MRDDEPVDALASLERTIEPPSSLERRIVRRLQHEGIVRRRRPLLKGLATAAAIAAIFAAGWFAGGASPGRTPVAGERYALLLYGEVAAPSAELVAEYSAWARTARAAGRHLTGERLERTSVVFGAGVAGDEPQGFFVFTAATAEDARALAASHPHIRRGGRIVLKRILPT
jgi:hypothetical protein